jgi:hypothetical protein
MTPMTRIWERLYIGSRLDAERLAKSNPYAITTVISLCEEPVIRRAPGINYLDHPGRGGSLPHARDLGCHPGRHCREHSLGNGASALRERHQPRANPRGRLDGCSGVQDPRNSAW